MTSNDRPTGDAAEVRLSRSDRLARLWERMEAQEGLWAWGGDNGFTPWIDSHGHDVIPLWSDARAAERESQDDADPDERAVFLPCARLIDGAPRLIESGVAEAGLESEGGRFLYTLPLEELVDRARAILAATQA